MAVELALSILEELVAIISRALTGSLLTSTQVTKITRLMTGDLFGDATAANKDAISNRIAAAKNHFDSANQIIGELKIELDTRAAALEELVQTIETRKKEADHYSELASVSAEASNALRIEIEKSIRSEARRGRVPRRIAAAIAWIFTLVAGAALGAYWNDLMALLGSWFQRPTSGVTG